MKRKTVLVTGGTGSIGSNIVKQLVASGIGRIIIFSRDDIKQYLMQQEIEDKRAHFIVGDIRDYDSIEAVFERYTIDSVFHAAAMKHLVMCENEPVECTKTNIIGTHNLMRLCIEYRVPRVVTISTDKAASPTSVMGASKYIAERITTNANFLTSDQQKFCCVRFGNVANSSGSVIPVMVKRLFEGKEIWVSDPRVTRFIMRISEAVGLVLRAAEISKGGETFVLKMPAFRLGDLAEVITERIAPLFGRHIAFVTRKLVTGEKLHEELLNEMETRYLLEDEEMYIVLRRNIADRSYDGFKKCSVKRYDSSTVPRLGLDQLEEIVLEYIKTRVGRHPNQS